MIVLMVHPNGTQKRWVPQRKIGQFERGGWRRQEQPVPTPERIRKPRKTEVASSEAENQEGSSS